MMQKMFSMTIKNRLLDLHDANLKIEDFSMDLDLPPKVLNALAVSVDEAVINIIKYGYDDDAEHDINIKINIESQFLTLEIEDDGQPFNPLEYPEADTESKIEDRKIGGLGIHLIRNLMDEISYGYKNGRNHLFMKKKF
jgi:anti-sigma regulatory factor (Ser/Thr protein kinase)